MVKFSIMPEKEIGTGFLGIKRYVVQQEVIDMYFLPYFCRPRRNHKHFCKENQPYFSEKRIITNGSFYVFVFINDVIQVILESQQSLNGISLLRLRFPNSGTQFSENIKFQLCKYVSQNRHFSFENFLRKSILLLFLIQKLLIFL